MKTLKNINLKLKKIIFFKQKNKQNLNLSATADAKNKILRQLID
jgi:hypothetical protein